MSIFSTIAKAVIATGVVSGAAGVGSKIYLKNGHGFGTMDVINATSNTPDSNSVNPTNSETIPPTDASSISQPQPTSESRTYGTELKKNKYELVDEKTDKSIIQNIMTERLDPTKDSLTFYYNTRFDKSPRVNYSTKTLQSSLNNENISLTLIQKPTETDAEAWRKACIDALARTVTDEVTQDKSNENKELARLREWCTIPTVDHVLRRHKLTPLSTDESDTQDTDLWKEVISGGWFKKEGDKKPWKDQSFIKGEDLKTVIGDQEEGIENKEAVTPEKINVFKKVCKAELSKAFTRNNFYLTTQFINGMVDDQKPIIDPFQEAALFCVKPFKASEYVTVSLQGDVQTSVVLNQSDYCHLTKPADGFDSWTTNNSLEGKTFWCAVRALYKAKPTGK
ncbi:hypothetical protein [Candidatus Mycoplasma haematohominis]|uniref:hypothetical protein n=1 Tax=Candidatus Mycoplasma haematohominis TaxID=1494318 RepID=UPI001C0A6C8C|nr:hypothetical protein [Candidatus Mycoplasma haemohominis]